jgi:hypothetical protein
MKLFLKSPVEWLRPPIPCPESLMLQLYEFWESIVQVKKGRVLEVKIPLNFADEVPVRGRKFYE